MRPTLLLGMAAMLAIGACEQDAARPPAPLGDGYTLMLECELAT